MSDGALDFGKLMDEGVEVYEQSLVDPDDKSGEEEGKELDLEAIKAELGDDAKGLSDEEITTLYNEAKPEEKEGEEEKPAEGEKEAEESGEKAEKPEDQSKPEAMEFANEEAFMGHTMKITVNGQETEVTVAEAKRAVERAALNEQRINATVAQRNELADANTKQGEELTALQKDAKYWKWVMDDETGGRFLEARKAYSKAILDAGPEQATVAPAATGEYTAAETKAGWDFYNKTLKGPVREMARSFSREGSPTTAADAQFLEDQIETALGGLLEKEGRFLSEPRLREIFQFDLPDMIRGAGWKGVGVIAPATQSTDSDETLALKAQVGNMKRELTKRKLASAPDAGGGGVGATGGETGKNRIDSAKSAAEVMEALSDPKETFGM